MGFGMDSYGLVLIVMDWYKFKWFGIDWEGQVWIGMIKHEVEWTGMDEQGLFWINMNCFGQGYVSIGIVGIGMDWYILSKTGLGRNKYEWMKTDSY